MNEEIKSRWVSKLTSGEYSQTTGTLNAGDGYCCLGVLCEIAVEDGIVIKTVGSSGRAVYTSKVNQSDVSADILPYDVVAWAGLNDTNPDVTYFDSNGLQLDDNLAELNDNGMKFEEIAKLIDENY